MGLAKKFWVWVQFQIRLAYFGNRKLRFTESKKKPLRSYHLLKFNRWTLGNQFFTSYWLGLIGHFKAVSEDGSFPWTRNEAYHTVTNPSFLSPSSYGLCLSIFRINWRLGNWNFSVYGRIINSVRWISILLLSLVRQYDSRLP